MEENRLEILIQSVSDHLSEEQKKKVCDFKTIDELLAFAKSEGIELSDELLDAVSGGYGEIDPPQPPRIPRELRQCRKTDTLSDSIFV